VTLSDHDRWQHVERLLHDDTIQLYARVAGLLILLYAQPLSRICRMKPEQVTLGSDGIVTVTLGTVAIEMPELLDRLVLAQLDRCTHIRYASHQKKWLFPGRHAGRHLATENIHPADARKAAMFQLAAEIPTPVLAELLGLSPATATRWATLAARDWSQYATMRRDQTVPVPHD
jgi:integrase